MQVPDGIERGVYIGIGSNMGARALLIDQAVRRIGNEISSVVATSFLYETAPQLVTDQPPFLNAAVLVKASGATADPHALMRALQAIEIDMGRASLGQRQRYGPRPIDLDILCYDDGATVVDTDDLVVPHALLRTRSFVLAPLSDIRGDLVIPSSLVTAATNDNVNAASTDGSGALHTQSATVDSLWSALRLQYPDEPLPRRVLPLGAHRIVDIEQVARARSPLLMAIVNATPDSFSGDGLCARGATLTAVEPVARALRQGADVIDVGGHSTRPGHDYVSVEEETRRVLDVVRAIGQTQETPDSAVDALVSIDTFRPEVARACIEALPPSADRAAAVVWINDVMGMRCDPHAMLKLLRQHDGLGIVIMHSRGALDAMVRDRDTAAHLLPESVQDGADTPHDIVDIVARDLSATVSWAESHGLPRWRVVLDPGIGFGKTPAENAVLAASAARLSDAVGGYPVLIGASRKSFLSRVTAAAAKIAGRTDAEPLSDETREHASHAVTAIAAWRHAHIVRVHDVVGSRAVLDVAAAMARPAGQ
ncbi:HPPK domain and Pterin binding domain containing protein [Pandoravirus neocaledonia]|uniref:HPPK domain and Pterin binding domain containing protein n=1 Tax=Pandoravirus neocaledonia TaxID=2107708 RepID=A0A2U7UB82_9VIRU|nr:HPPK domain and Pterin binding domain containing protein [Pandoravirus neocaledonia]AVK75652.1 HPPK domain and Pterin binding domain containing protein [Pandoravirus neocaledonia]